MDYTTTTGTKTRWGAIDVAHSYPDLSANDAKALTYTTPPLELAVEVTRSSGRTSVAQHCCARTWMPLSTLRKWTAMGDPPTSPKADLRASHRKLGQAPFNNFGLPFQSHYQADQESVPAGEPFEMVFTLLPTSYRFHAGSRIRITLAFADAGNFDTPILNPAPVLQLLRDAGHPSFVELPVQQQP